MGPTWYSCFHYLRMYQASFSGEEENFMQGLKKQNKTAIHDEASRGHPNQMSKPSQLDPLDVECGVKRKAR